MISFSLIFTDQTLLFVFIIDSSLVAESKLLGCIFQFLEQRPVNLKKKINLTFFHFYPMPLAKSCNFLSV